MRNKIINEVISRSQLDPEFKRDELLDFIDTNLNIATGAVRSMGLGGINEHFEKRAKFMAKLKTFEHMSVGWAEKVEAAILFVDMRGSTARADSLPAQDTFMTMQALIPTLAYIASGSGGHIAGYRGDGLFAVFGLDDEGKNPPTFDYEHVVKRACVCGKIMINATNDIVNESLRRRGIKTGVEVGVGIGAGTVVITKIGLAEANEVTAYGDQVNKAAKLSCGRSKIFTTLEASLKYPKSKNGKTTITPVPLGKDLVGYSVAFPPGYPKNDF